MNEYIVKLQLVLLMLYHGKKLECSFVSVSHITRDLLGDLQGGNICCDLKRKFVHN